VKQNSTTPKSSKFQVTQTNVYIGLYLTTSMCSIKPQIICDGLSTMSRTRNRSKGIKLQHFGIQTSINLLAPPFYIQILAHPRM